MAPVSKASASRSAKSASTAAAVPAFMSAEPLPRKRSPSTRGGTNGKWTVSRCPLNCSVLPGRLLGHHARTCDGRCLRVAAGGPFHRETVGGHDFSQAIKGRSRGFASVRLGTAISCVSVRANAVVVDGLEKGVLAQRLGPFLWASAWKPPLAERERRRGLICQSAALMQYSISCRWSFAANGPPRR